MKKIFYSTMLLLILSPLLFFMPSVNANSGQAYEVGTDILNVRVKPDHDAKVTGQLEFGDNLIGFQEKHGWVQTYYDGKEAWVASQYLIKSQTDIVQDGTTNGGNIITIDADSVRLRTGPGTNYTIIGHTSHGDVYELIEKKKDWYKILLEDGSSGWVASWLTNKASVQQSLNSKEKSTDINGSLDGYNIMLDPGHGGKDPGALGMIGEKEKDLTLKVANSVAQKLQNAGATVLMTRSDDAFIALEERVNISQSYWTDAFISLHYNAFLLNESNGISTHYYSNGPDQRLAQEIQNALEKYTNFKSRGVQHDSYHVLRENKDLSVLVELGFITNPNDQAIIHSENHPSSVANAITEGLINYFDY